MPIVMTDEHQAIAEEFLRQLETLTYPLARLISEREAAAIAAEREACAQLVSRLAADHGLDPESYAGYIRARGGTE